MGHRGNAAHAPENTIESFGEAVALGVDALELDVHLTRDGHVVVHHDRTTRRTTGRDVVVAAATLGELQTLDAGARFSRAAGHFPHRDRGVRIPTIESVLETFPDTPLLVEIKARAAAAPLRRIVERFGAADRVVVDAFDAACLAPFVGSRIAIGSSRPDVVRLLARALANVAPPRVGYRAVCVPRRHGVIPLPIARFVRLLAPLGVPVHVWTVNDPAEAVALWRAGVRGLVSDDPGALLAARASFRPATR